VLRGGVLKEDRYGEGRGWGEKLDLGVESALRASCGGLEGIESKTNEVAVCQKD